MSFRVVVLNAAKMDYDGSLDFSGLSDEVVIYPASAPEEIASRVGDADAIVTKELVLTEDQVRAFPDTVKLICEAGTGYNNIPIGVCQERGITVCNVPAYSSERVAHTAIMMILSLSSSVQRQIRMLERKDRRNFHEHLMVPHTEVNGKTLGVIGAGNIGRTVIKVARALGMDILVYTRTPREDEEGITYTDLDTVLRQADYLTLHCPLTDETRHFIDREAVSKMKRTAFLINTSRGALIDERALIEALREGQIAGAGLDVQETEPPADDNPLYDMENVIITPHMGWKGFETRQRLVSVIEANIRAFCSGRPQNVVS